MSAVTHPYTQWVCDDLSRGAQAGVPGTPLLLTHGARPRRFWPHSVRGRGVDPRRVAPGRGCARVGPVRAAQRLGRDSHALTAFAASVEAFDASSCIVRIRHHNCVLSVDVNLVPPREYKARGGTHASSECQRTVSLCLADQLAHAVHRRSGHPACRPRGQGARTWRAALLVLRLTATAITRTLWSLWLASPGVLTAWTSGSTNRRWR